MTAAVSVGEENTAQVLGEICNFCVTFLMSVPVDGSDGQPREAGWELAE